MEDEIVKCTDVSNVAANDFCKFETLDIRELEKHVEAEHTVNEKTSRKIQVYTKVDTILALKGPLSCSKCKNYLNKPQWKMRKHIETHTKEGWSQCSLCQKTFPDSWHLKVHERSHTGERPHICSYCDNTYPDLSKLKRHLQTHDETSEYKLKLHKCLLCGIGFDQSYKLKVHMNYHNSVKPYKCDECTKSFTEKRVLKRHQSSHKEKDHNCSLCVRKFVHPVQLQMHITRHKISKCSFCPFKSTTKADLTKHAKLHDIIDLEPQSCSECGKNFRIKSMEKHMKTHTQKCISTFDIIKLLKGSAPCKRCKNYISKPFWRLKKHITTSHTREGRFKCKYCDKRFIDSWHLREHERSHTGEKPFQCSVCQIYFSATGSMNQHVKQMHKLTQ